jgi:phospholipid/cholesterol/gamma-HCH transport system permease protein
MSIPSPLRPRLTMARRRVIERWNRLGEQTAFYVTSVVHIREAVVKYTGETLRVIAQLSLGTGVLALIGGATVITAFLLGNVGIVVGFQGKADLDKIGVFALAGFFTAYIVPRVGVPLITAFGLIATVGAGTTAQLGAMRVSEEIDALEVMGIDTISYLVSTRVLAGVIIAVPVGCLAQTAGVWVSRFMFTTNFGQSSGGYEHYFRTFLNPADTVYAVIQVGIEALVIMLIHTYYGFTATGGPAGVGEATGRAVRASLVVATFATLFVVLALFGRSGNFHLSG